MQVLKTPGQSYLKSSYLLNMADHHMSTNEAEPLLTLEEHNVSLPSLLAAHPSSVIEFINRQDGEADNENKTSSRNLSQQSGDEGLSLYETKCLLIGRCISLQHCKICTNSSFFQIEKLISWAWVATNGQSGSYVDLDT